MSGDLGCFVEKRSSAEIARSLNAGVSLNTGPGYPRNPDVRAIFALFAPGYQVELKDDLQRQAQALIRDIVANEDLFRLWRSAIRREVECALMFLTIQDGTNDARLDEGAEWMEYFLHGLMHVRFIEGIYRLSLPLYFPPMALLALRIPALTARLLETMTFADLCVLSGDSTSALYAYGQICQEVFDLSFRADEIGQLAFNLLNSGRDEMPVGAFLERFERDDLQPGERQGVTLRLILAGENVKDLPRRLLDVITREASSPDLEREMCALQVAAFLFPNESTLIAQALRRARQMGSWSLDALFALYRQRGLTTETAPPVPQLQLMMAFESQRISALEILTQLRDDSAESRAIVVGLLGRAEMTLWPRAYRLAEAIRINPAELMPHILQGFADSAAVLREAAIDEEGLTDFLPFAREYLCKLLGDDAAAEAYCELVRSLSAQWQMTIPEE